MISIRHKGNFKYTELFLQGTKEGRYTLLLTKYGIEGVRALSAATPVDTGLTASSWSYNVEVDDDRYILSWSNSNVQNGVPIAVIIQHGHGTGAGVYVPGIDYINPAIRPIFDKLSNAIWKEVTSY